MSSLTRTFSRVALAAVVAFAITAVGQGLWGLMVMANLRLTPAIPWSAPAMALILLALVVVLTGRGWPRKGAAARRALVPLAKVSAGAWTWSLIAGGTGVVAAAALWTVLAQLVRVPPNVLIDLHGAPVWTLALILLTSVTAAPLTEEIAFRGYAMSLVRRRLPPAAALLVTSALFASVHLTQGLVAPKLVVYFLAGLLFGFIALRTGSLIPAMVVHSFGDLIFFTQVWSHDAGRRLVGHGGDYGAFFGQVAVAVVAAALCLLACRALVQVTQGPTTKKVRPVLSPIILAS